MLKHITKLRFSCRTCNTYLVFVTNNYFQEQSKASVLAVISLKASLFIAQAQCQRTAVYCVFSVLHVIR